MYLNHLEVSIVERNKKCHEKEEFGVLQFVWGFAFISDLWRRLADILESQITIHLDRCRPALLVSTVLLENAVPASQYFQNPDFDILSSSLD